MSNAAAIQESRIQTLKEQLENLRVTEFYDLPNFTTELSRRPKPKKIFWAAVVPLISGLLTSLYFTVSLWSSVSKSFIPLMLSMIFLVCTAIAGIYFLINLEKYKVWQQNFASRAPATWAPQLLAAAQKHNRTLDEILRFFITKTNFEKLRGAESSKQLLTVIEQKLPELKERKKHFLIAIEIFKSIRYEPRDEMFAEIADLLLDNSTNYETAMEEVKNMATELPVAGNANITYTTIPKSIGGPNTVIHQA